MALTATIFKAALQVSDMDRGYYNDHQLTLARHPSETDERMMVRLLAFALHANDRLSFTRGLCADEEPDLWLKGLSDEIKLWVDVGLPDERRVRKACNRSAQVVLYTYGGRGAQLWLERNLSKLRRFDNLCIIDLNKTTTAQLATLAERTMVLQITIQDRQIWLSKAAESFSIEPTVVFGESISW